MNTATFKEFTDQRRQELAKSGAAMEDGSFPIESLQDLKNAIRAVGRAKSAAAARRHIIKRAKALGATDELPDDWEADMSHRAAFFALDSPTRIEGDYVIRSGKFFETDRPFVDMNGVEFAISTKEAGTKLSAAPVWTGPTSTSGLLNIQHEETPFTVKMPGKLGGVRRYWLDGSDIYAEYALHKDIHSFFDGCPLEMSSEWDIPSKTPLGAALVVHPAVEDAVMYMAQFAAKVSSEMQDHHDMAVRQGAECPGKTLFMNPEELKTAGTLALYMTPDTLSAVQHIHDHAKENGASCDLYATKRGMFYAAPSSGSAGKGALMKVYSKLKALFQKAGASEAEIDDALKELHEPPIPTHAPTTPTAGAFAESPEFKAMKAQVDAIGAQNAMLQTQLAAQSQTALFAQNCTELDSLVRAFKMDRATASVWRDVAKNDPAAFAAALPALKAGPILAQLSSQGRQGPIEIIRPDGAIAGGSADPTSQLLVKAHELVKGLPMLPTTGDDLKDRARAYNAKVAAFKQAARDNPDLARAHWDTASADYTSRGGE